MCVYVRARVNTFAHMCVYVYVISKYICVQCILKSPVLVYIQRIVTSTSDRQHQENTLCIAFAMGQV